MKRIFILLIILIAAYEAFQLDAGFKQKQALKAQLSQIINQKGSIQAQLKETQDTVGLLGEQITNLKKSLQQKETDKAELQKQIEDAKESARDFSEKLIEAKTNIAKINKELKLTRNEKEALENTNLKLNISLQDLAEKIKLSQEILKLAEQKSSARNDTTVMVSQDKLTQLLKSWDGKERQFNILKTRL